MSTRNFDSSLLTQRKGAKALAAYASALQRQIDSATGQFVVRSTQPTYQSAVVVTYQNLGKCYCVKDAEANPYGFNPSGGSCGCGTGAS